MKKSRFTALVMLALILTLGTIHFGQTSPVVPIGQTIQTTPYESNPTTHSSSGITPANPTWAYDGDWASACTFGYGVDGYINLSTFDVPGSTFTIGWVDFKIRYKADSSTDDRYRIGYRVSPSTAWQPLQDWVSGTAAGFNEANRPWSTRSEPNNGAWDWTDIANVKVSVETDLVNTNDAKTFTLYEVWLSVYPAPLPPAGLSIQPSTLNLAPGSKFFTDVYAAQVDDLWAYQYNLYFDSNIIRPIVPENYTYYPYYSVSPNQGMFNYTYLPVTGIDDSLNLNGFSNVRNGWLRMGSSPYLDIQDYPQNFITSARNLTIIPDGNGYYKGPTVTIKPDGDDAGYKQWSIYPAAPTTHYDKVDENLTIADGFTDDDYIYATAQGKIDAFSLTLPSGAGSIWGVKVTVVARNTVDNANATVTPMLVIGGTKYLAPANQTPVLEYGFYTYTWAKNPSTTNDWQWSDLTNLEAGVSSWNPTGRPWGTGNELRVTQLTVEINPDWTRGGLTPAATDWQSWDETAYGDGDNTYVSVSCNGHVESSTLSNPPVGVRAGTITKLKLHIIARNSESSNEALYPTLVIGGTKYYLTSLVPQVYYNHYPFEFSYNPSTGLNWTWDEIDSLEAGVESVQSGTTLPPWEGQLRVTALWVEVVYDTVGDDIGDFSFPDMAAGGQGGKIGVELFAGQNTENLYPSSGPVIRPTGNGFYTAWGNDYAYWDDISQDGDNTYVYATSVGLNETSTLSNPVHSGTVWGVRLTIVARNTVADSNATIAPTIRVGGKDYNGSLVTPGTSYSPYRYTWWKNPFTGSAWSWSDIDALEAGVRSLKVGVGSWTGELRVTQLYVEAIVATGDDSVELWVNDGASWTLASTFTPPNASITWTGVDVSFILDTPTKINNAKVHLVKKTSGVPDDIVVDAIRIRKIDWTRVGGITAPYLRDIDYPENYVASANRTILRPDGNGLYQGRGDLIRPDYYGTYGNITLRPNADTATVNWTPSTVGTHWNLVDETTPNTSDWVKATSGNVIDLYNVQDVSPSPSWTPKGVRLTIVANQTSGGPENLEFRLVSGATTSTPYTATPSTASYTAYSYTWAQDPNTPGVDWTWAAINSMQVGFRSVAVGGFGTTMYVTQVYVEVLNNKDWTGDYTGWDEVVPNTSDYVSATSNNLNESSTFANVASPPAWGVASVRLTVRAIAGSPGDERIMPMLVIGGKGYNGTSFRPTTSYVNYVSVWGKNPATGAAWTWDDINSLEAGVRSQLVGSWNSGELRVTQIYIEINPDWTKSGTSPAPTDWQSWDDTALDYEETYVQSQTNGNNETSTLTNIPHVGTIAGVKLTIVAKTVSPTDDQIRLLLVVGGKGYNGSLTGALELIYKPYSYTWLNNPAGGAWTWADIDSLEAGVTFQQFGTTIAGYLRVTQLYVEVFIDSDNGVLGDLLFDDMPCENYGKKIDVQMYMRGDGDDQVEVWIYDGGSYSLVDTLTPTTSWSWVTGTADIGMWLLDTKDKINGTRAYLVKKTNGAAGLIEVDEMRLRAYTGVVKMAYNGWYGPGGTVTGNTPLTRIYWQVVAGAYGSTPLDIVSSKLINSTGHYMTHSVTDGWFSNGIIDVRTTVTSPLATVGFNGSDITKNHRNITVTVDNQGLTTQTFDVRLCWNDTNVIGTQTVTSLPASSSKTLSFQWNPILVSEYGNVTLTAKAQKLPGETATGNNYLTSATEMIVTFMGNCFPDATVDTFDKDTVYANWGQPGYVRNADINDDGKIDTFDKDEVYANWGRTS